MFIFPLTFASTAFVQASGMPGPLRAFAENQPVTQVIEAIRALLLDKPLGSYGWKALAWSIGIIVISVPIATILFRKRAAH